MIPSEAILAFIDRLERENVCLHGFELREGGAVRAQGYYAPFARHQPHRMYSISKSMVSLAVGLLAEEGKLSLDDHIVDYFGDKITGEPDARLARLTIRDMLRMATCFRKTTYREGVDYSWSASYFTAKPDHEPGTMFFYDTSCSQVLGELCHRLSGKPVIDFLTERVFAPLGATDEKRWLTDPAGEAQGGTGLIMSLSDLGKVAQCIMDGGNGVLPQAYLREATSWQIGTPCQGNPEEKNGYGYQFWRTRSGYAMYGMGGQMAIFCPQEELLLCTIADTRLDPYGVQRLYDAFYDEIVAHIDEAGDPDADAALEWKLSTLACAAVRHTPGAWREGPRAYRMEENEAGLRAVTLDTSCVTVVWADAEHRFAWEKPGACAQGCFPGTDIPCLTSAGLSGDGALHVRCHVIGDAPCGLEMVLAERDGTLSVRMLKSSDPLTNRYEGLFFGEA